MTQANLASAFVHLGTKDDQLKGGLDSALGMVRSWGKAAAGLAVAVLGASSAAAAKYEQSLAMISTMLDEQGSSILPTYKREILNLSAEFGQSAEALSKAVYDVLSASIDAGQAMDVVRTASIAAGAGMTTVDVATRALVNTMNAYHLGANKAEAISDKMFQTVKRGQFTFEELAGNLGQVAPAAYVAGISLDEMLASLATITRAGVSAPEAITQLNSVLTTFLKGGSDDAIKAARAFGVELTQAQLKATGLIGAMRLLQEASGEQLAAIFEESRAMKGAAVLTKDLAGFQTDLAEIGNAAGASQAAFAKMSATATHELSRLKPALFAAAAEIGESLLPGIKDLVTIGVPTIRSWGSAVAGVVGDVTAWFNSLGPTVQDVNTYLDDLDIHMVLWAERTKSTWKSIVDIWRWGVDSINDQVLNTGITFQQQLGVMPALLEAFKLTAWKLMEPMRDFKAEDLSVYMNLWAQQAAVGTNLIAPRPLPDIAKNKTAVENEAEIELAKRVRDRFLDKWGMFGGFFPDDSPVRPIVGTEDAADMGTASARKSATAAAGKGSAGAILAAGDVWKQMQESIVGLAKDKKLDENTLATMLNTKSVQALSEAMKRGATVDFSPLGA